MKTVMVIATVNHFTWHVEVPEPYQAGDTRSDGTIGLPSPWTDTRPLPVAPSH